MAEASLWDCDTADGMASLVAVIVYAQECGGVGAKSRQMIFYHKCMEGYYRLTDFMHRAARCIKPSGGWAKRNWDSLLDSLAHPSRIDLKTQVVSDLNPSPRGLRGRLIFLSLSFFPFFFSPGEAFLNVLKLLKLFGEL